MIPTGAAGTRQTLEIMKRLTLAGKKSPVVRQLAVSLTQGLHQKDFYGEITALFRFVRDRIRYIKDVRNVETLHTPEMVLSNRQGDCDDKALLLASLLESIGFRTRFVAVGFRANEYSHVYTEVFYNAHSPDKLRGPWLPLETTENVDIGWSPKKVVSRLIVTNDAGTGGVGTLGGKRVKKVLAQVAATAAAAQAAASQPGATQAQIDYAAAAQAQNAAEINAFNVAQANKPKGIISKLKAVRLKIDPVARSQEYLKNVKKVGFKEATNLEKEKLKNEHLKATKLMAATGSPSFKKHAQFEENKFKATDLKTQLVQVQGQLAQDPTNTYLQDQQSSIVTQLNTIADENKAYIKSGKIAAAILSIVVGFFTFGGGSAAVSGIVEALKQGAVDLAKKFMLGAIANGLAKGGSKEDAAKAKAAADMLSQYPPDPNLNTLDEMLADSQAKKDAAQQKTLGWLLPVGLFILSSLT